MIRLTTWQSTVWAGARAAVVLCIAGFVLALDAFAADIRLKATGNTTQSIVRLADVAEIAGADEREAAALGQIALGPGPAAGAETRFDVATIRSRLAARGVNMAQTTLSGSALVIVRNGATPATAAKAATGPDERTLLAQQKRAEKLVEEAVRAHLSRTAAGLGKARVAVQIDRKDVPAVLQGAGAGFQVAGGKAPWNEPQTLTIRALDRNNAVCEIPVVCQVAPLPVVMAAKRTLAKGQILRAEDLVPRQAENTEGVFESVGELIGLETQRTLRPEEVIRRDDVRSVPLIRSNDIVTVYSRRGGIVVKSPMKARSDGAAGETVTLVTLDGRQTIMAVVSGYHEAEVGGVPERETQEPGGIRVVSGTSERPGQQRRVEPIATIERDSAAELPPRRSLTPRERTPR